MTPTSRVRVNPADTGEFAVYVDPDDRSQPWVRSGGAVVGWEWDTDVADWPEFELTIPELARETP